MSRLSFPATPVHRYAFGTISIITIILFSSWVWTKRNTNLYGLAGNVSFTSITAHKVKVNGKVLNYRSTTGYIPVMIADRYNAKIFYTAYRAVDTSTARPVTFVFNGGPGSSSIWLHMGSIGPVRAVPGKKGYSNNADTWLPFTDLVFIDPVGTGYSRTEEGTDARRFYGYQSDIQAIGSFIQSYLVGAHASDKPIYIAGESYGAARAVGLAAYLHDTLRVHVAGLNLISPALDYELLSFRKGNDKPYTHYLPAYALAAQHHERLKANWQQLPADSLLNRVKTFAGGTYQKFLNSGGSIPLHVADTLSAFTGLSAEQIIKLNGRIPDHVFVRTILGRNNTRTGIFDTRDTGYIKHSDPGELRLRKVFPEAFLSYAKQQLRYNNKLPYLATTETSGWNYGATPYLNVTATLASLLKRNPAMRVHITGGIYDLATPPETVTKALEQLNNNYKINSRLSTHYYQAGHLFYTDDEANKQWRNDSEDFYAHKQNE